MSTGRDGGGGGARVCGRYRGTEVADVAAMAESGKVF